MKRTHLPVSSIRIKMFLKPVQWTTKSILILFLLLAALVVATLIAPKIVIGWLVVIGTGVAAIHFSEKRFQKRMLLARGKGNIETFITRMNPRAFPAIVIRYVYESIRHGNVEYQIFPDDDLQNDLQINDEDLTDIVEAFERDFAITATISDIAAEPEIKTVHDLIAYCARLYTYRDASAVGE